LLFIKFHRSACEVEYYLKEFYSETELALATVAEKAIFAFAAVADEAIFALAAIADEAIFALAAVAEKAIFAFTAVAFDEAIFAAVGGIYAFLACIAIFAFAAIAFDDAWVFVAGYVVHYVVFVVFVVFVVRRVPAGEISLSGSGFACPFSIVACRVRCCSAGLRVWSGAFAAAFLCGDDRSHNGK